MKALKNVLLVNALSSAATGLGLVIFASTVALLFGIESSTPVLEVGLFLIGFALLVFRESRRPVPNAKNTKLIIVVDITWVLASSSIVAMQLFSLTPLGYFAIGAVALWVAGMAILQFNGLKRVSIS